MTTIHTEVIDAHHHLWKYSREEYPWMLDGMGSIRRDFLIDELKVVQRQANVEGFVTVQARQTVAETAWLLQLASRHRIMRAVVGWIPLTDPEVASVLERFADNPNLRAVRHVLHDEPDDFYILREDFNHGVGLLKDFGLCYDILVFERHLPQTIQFVDRHPQQIFVLDHIAKPKIKDGVLSPWREHIRELAKRENVYCKLSGLVTEADWHNWTEADLEPYMEIVLESFGPQRVMFGSDWPVSLIACAYGTWLDVVRRAVAKLSPSDQAAVLGGTAKRAYGF